MVLDQVRALEDVLPGGAQLVGIHVREARLQRLLDRHLGAQEVAPEHRQRIETGRGELHLLVLDQPAHQLGARVLGFLAVGRLLRRQQHAGLDLDQHRRHEQVFARELEVGLADLVDIGQVLARHVGQRDVEDVEVLLADQVQQQVQRAFERFEEDFQRIRRDVKVDQELDDRLAVELGDHV